MIINPKRLAYFQAVYTHKKIRKAAEYLDSYSSVVTRQIQLLEEELECQLFVRHPGVREVIPTRGAEALLEYCHRSRELQEFLEKELQDVRSMRGGSINLAIPSTFVGALMGVLEDFRCQYPNINLHIEEIFESPKIVHQILEDRSHIGIAHICPEVPDIQRHAHVSLPLRMLVSKNHPLADRHKVTFAEAIGYPFTLPASGMLLRTVESVARSEKIMLPSPALVSNSTIARKKFVYTNPGTVFMSAFSAREEIQGRDLIALEIDHPVFNSIDLSLITRRGKPLFPAMEHLLKLLRIGLSIFKETPGIYPVPSTSGT